MKNAAVIPLKIITPLVSIPALQEQQTKSSGAAEQCRQDSGCPSKSTLQAVDENEAEILTFASFRPQNSASLARSICVLTVDVYIKTCSFSQSKKVPTPK